MLNASNRVGESGVHKTAAASRFLASLPELIAQAARETTRSEVASRIALDFVIRLGARTARVYLTCPDGSALHLAAAENIEAAVLTKMVVVSIEDQFPASVAARLGLLCVVPANDALTFGRDSGGDGVALAIPLFAGSQTIGAVVAGFDELLPQESLLLGLLSHSLGALLDRARLAGELERSEARVRAQDDRNALIVHDLRQPLNGLLMAAANLAKRAPIGEQRSLGRLRVCAVHLNRMVSDLCDTALLESGQVVLRRRSSDVVALVRDVVKEHLPRASLSIVGEIPAVVLDPQRVEQVLGNLLSNAAKYGAPEGAARVAVEVVCHESRVLISVTNEGEGISKDERARVFDAHYRGRHRRPGAIGLGLGLYICRELVEQHGGHIWTDGDRGVTRFSFSLPLDFGTSPDDAPIGNSAHEPAHSRASATLS